MKPIDGVLLVIYDEDDEEMSQAVCRTVAEAKFLGYKATEEGGSFTVLDVVYSSKYPEFLNVQNH